MSMSTTIDPSQLFRLYTLYATLLVSGVAMAGCESSTGETDLSDVVAEARSRLSCAPATGTVARSRSTRALGESRVPARSPRSAISRRRCRPPIGV